MAIYERDLERCQPVSAEASLQLFDAWKSGDMRSRDRLIESVLRLGYTAAKRFASKRIPLVDLILEANEASVRGVDYWNPSRGKLPDICRSFIYNALREYLWKKGHRGIYIPLKTLMSVTAGQLDSPRMKRRVELRLAAVAVDVVRFSELSDDFRSIQIAAPREVHDEL